MSRHRKLFSCFVASVVSLSSIVALAAEPRELPSAKPESVGMSSAGLAKVSESLQGFVDEE